MKQTTISGILWVLCLLYASALWAQSGVVDSTFGIDGLAFVPQKMGVPRYVSNVYSWHQSDGKQVIVGDKGPYGEDSEMIQTRLNTDGSIDTTFPNGRVASLTLDHLVFAQQLSDERYFIVYQFNLLDNSVERRVSYFTAEGVLDTTPSGGVYQVMPMYFPFAQRNLLVQPDGKMVIYGHRNEEQDWGIARYWPDFRPDSTFGINGFCTVPGPNWAFSMLQMQEDGKFLFTGEESYSDTLGFIRFQNNGVLDSTFSEDGVLIFSGGWGVTDRLGITVLQPDHKLIFAKIDEFGSSELLIMLRFLENGLPDLGFGTDGRVFFDTDQGMFYPSSTVDLGVDQQGHIKVWAQVSLTDSIAMYCAAFLENGQTDLTFGTNGELVTSSDRYNSIKTLLFNPDDGSMKLVSTFAGGNQYRYLSVRKWLSDGQSDTAFNAGDAVFIPYPEEITPLAFAQMSTGHIVMIGIADNGRQKSGRIIHLQPDGSIDGSFGINGSVDHLLADDGFNVRDAFVWADGSAALLLNSDVTSASKVYKLNISGELDTSFGVNGVSILMDKYSKIKGLTNGSLLMSKLSGDHLLLQLTANGMPDPSFGNEGNSAEPPLPPIFLLRDFSIQDDGRIVVAGNLRATINGVQKWLTRLFCMKPTGVLDSTFGVNGIVVYDFFDYERIEDIALQADGKILLTGRTSGPTEVYIIRLNADGSRDVSFGENGVVGKPLLQYSESAKAIAQLSNGKIVIGIEEIGLDYRYLGVFLYAFLPDGGVDSTWLVGTGAYFPGRSSVNFPCKIVGTNENQLLVLGQYLNYAHVHPVFSRMNTQTVLSVKAAFDEGISARIYPNPVAHDLHQVTLEVNITQSGPLNIELFTLDGKWVSSLHQGHYPAGYHQILLYLPDALPAGMYYCRVGNEIVTIMMSGE